MHFKEELKAYTQALQHQGRDCHFHLKHTDRMPGAALFASTNMDATKKVRQFHQLENRASPVCADQIELASSKTIKKNMWVSRFQSSSSSETAIH
jgi:hypothetical protein